jgi:hypothetical protein
MVKCCTTVAVILLMLAVLGCNSTGETKVSGDGISAADQLKVDPNWGAEPVRDWRVLVRPEKVAEATKPTEAAKPVEAPAATPEGEKTEATPSENPEAPEDLADEAEVREVPKATEGGASVEMVPEEKKPIVPEPVLDSHDVTAVTIVEAEHMAVRELATLGAVRCMVCDDVSDLNQCVTCGHHHKKTTQCPAEHLNFRCEACYGQKGETVVVYPADAPCGACGAVHESGPHCPHCEKSQSENK